MTRKNRQRRVKRSPRRSRGRYSTGELFLAGLGALILILIVVLAASALVGGR